MKIKLPHTFADLSVAEWQILHKDSAMLDKLVALSGIDKKKVSKLPKKALDVAYSHIEELSKGEYGEHIEKLTIQDVQYGFVNDWDAFTMGEYIDMEEYCKDLSKNANKILALLYREIEREEGKKYWIKPYTAKEDPEKFNNIPATVFGGVLSFFLHSKKSLLRTMRQSLVEIMKEGTLEKNGDGTLPYIPSLKRIFSKCMQLPKNLWARFLHIFAIYKT
tara:strand:+ start:14471 stop:15130 length:660 start_codon:yes stop_codon:yes gene_type:complete